MRLVTDFLDNASREYRDKLAFVEKDSIITYSELYDISGRIATGIIETGIVNKPVAIMMSEGLLLLETLLGVAYSGNYFSLINPGLPIKRIESMLEVLKPGIIIADHKLAEEVFNFTSGLNGCLILDYEKLINYKIDRDRISLIRSGLTDSDLLYVVFTSGSTGTPKGCAITHRNAAYTAQIYADHFGIEKESVIANHFSMFFVGSMFVMFSSILLGATCLIGMDSLAKESSRWKNTIEEYHVNSFAGTTAFFAFASQFGLFNLVDFSCIRQVFVGGSGLSVAKVEQWIEKFPNATVIGGYGMSELGGGCSLSIDIKKWLYEKKREKSVFVPLGCPVENTDAFVVDENGNRAGVGVKGELYVRFSAMSDGYYNNLDENEKIFVQNPLEKRFRDICVKTGDMAYINDEGLFCHAGRIDFMVKRRGVRIEMGEIENSTLQAGAGECVCVFDYNSEKIIDFYTGDVSEKQIFDHLRGALPSQNMPDRIVRLDSMPLNQNGKYDREKLSGMLIGIQ